MGGLLEMGEEGLAATAWGGRAAEEAACEVAAAVFRRQSRRWLVASLWRVRAQTCSHSKRRAP